MNFKHVSLLVLGSALCFAETINGKLVDVACGNPGKESGKHPDQLKIAACTPTAGTKIFGIETTEGKILKLDPVGSTKAASIFAGVPKDASKTDVQVTVNGAVTGDTLKVDAISLR